MGPNARLEEPPSGRSGEATSSGAPRRELIGCLSSAPGNPYLSLLYDHLEDESISLAPGATLRASWLWRHRREVAFLHVHWPEGLYRFERGPRPVRALLSWLKLPAMACRLRGARLLGYRVVWTIHQLYPHESESRIQDRIAARAIAGSCSLLLAHDEATAEKARHAFPQLVDRVRVVAHGSYVGVYPVGRSRPEVRNELGIPDDAFVFVSFGELRGYKDVSVLLEAFRSAAVERTRLVIAGHPKDHRLAEAVAHAAEADPRIVPLLRYVPAAEVAALFAACDAAIVTRRDGGTSGSLILAASLGLPVVAADLPTYRELTGTRGGWLFAPGDTASLREVIVEAARNPGTAAERGRVAYAVAESLRWPDIAARTASHLRETLASASLPIH